MQNRNRLLALVLLSSTVFAAPAPAAQEYTEGAEGRPDRSFSGCDRVEAEFSAAKANTSTPQASHPSMSERTDPLTRREFASSSLAEISSARLAADAEACWSRLDGLWKEDAAIALDKEFYPEGWASASLALESLASGVYTMPRIISVEAAAGDANILYVRVGPRFDNRLTYRSDDGVSLNDVLQRNRERKVFRAEHASQSDLPGLLTVDVTRTGYARLRIGSWTFLRPRPATSKQDWSGQVSENDPFMIGFTLENIVANRRGYDLAFQNPDRFLDNSKAEIFRNNEQGYAIAEKRIVPLGFQLAKEDVQGNIHYTSAISTERGYQQLSSSAFGSKARVSASMNGPISGDIGISAGYNNAREKFQSLKRTSYVAEEVGFMRYKKYALVLDHSYAQLSDRFIDAVDDAYRTGNFRALIDKYGTHYAYAITYGAAGKVSQYISKDAYFREYGSASERGREKSTSVLLAEGTSYRTNSVKSGTSVSETNEYGERVFTAVGGNGSWSEAGFAAGDAQYPILADLRPIDELLSPVYFPDEPQIYIQARRALATAIDNYLYQFTDLSDDTLLPDPSSYRQVAGCWAFTDNKGIRLRNMIELSNGAIVARRAGAPGKGSIYSEIADYTFQADTGSAVYFFGEGGVATWRSNDNRSLVFRLTRVGDRC